MVYENIREDTFENFARITLLIYFSNIIFLPKCVAQKIPSVILRKSGGDALIYLLLFSFLVDFNRFYC